MGPLQRSLGSKFLKDLEENEPFRTTMDLIVWDHLQPNHSTNKFTSHLDEFHEKVRQIQIQIQIQTQILIQIQIQTQH